MRRTPPPIIPRQMPPGGVWRRTPPAIFPPIMGLLGLGLAWRPALAAAGIPGGAAEAWLGAASLLWAFAAIAYLGKVVQRPAVVVEDLRLLPGRAGLAAAVLGGLLVAAALVAYAPGAARWMAFGGLALHALLAVTVARIILGGPPEGRVVTPVFHLTFVGFILGALALAPLGHTGAASAILWATMAVAAAVWAVSLRDLAARIPPAPLRPLLAIHLAPASLFATVAALMGHHDLALAFAALAGAILLVLLAVARWLTVAGFSALWGAFTFPLAACAGAFLAVGWAVAGIMLTVAASAVTLWVALRVLRDWARGSLAERTNAATA
ncbi:MAG: tellurium resistance protein [Gemmobacter sp.]